MARRKGVNKMVEEVAKGFAEAVDGKVEPITFEVINKDELIPVEVLPASTLAEQAAGRDALARWKAEQPKPDKPSGTE